MAIKSRNLGLNRGITGYREYSGAT